ADPGAKSGGAARGHAPIGPRQTIALRTRRMPTAPQIDSTLNSASNGMELAVRGRLRSAARPLVPTAPDCGVFRSLAAADDVFGRAAVVERRAVACCAVLA